MRSDQIILQLHKFINNFQFDKLGFLAYVNSEGGYLMDYCICGSVLDMIDAFDYYENSAIPKAAEKKIVETFLTKRGFEMDTSFENFKNKFSNDKTGLSRLDSCYPFTTQSILV